MHTSSFRFSTSASDGWILLRFTWTTTNLQEHCRCSSTHHSVLQRLRRLGRSMHSRVQTHQIWTLEQTSTQSPKSYKKLYFHIVCYLGRRKRHANTSNDSKTPTPVSSKIPTHFFFNYAQQSSLPTHRCLKIDLHTLLIVTLLSWESELNCSRKSSEGRSRRIGRAWSGTIETLRNIGRSGSS